MTRDEFLEKLFLMFPNTFTENNIAIWKEAYEQVLKADWDYKKLFYKFLKSYQHTNIAPAPAFFVEFTKDVEPEKKNEGTINLEEYMKNAEAPTEEFLKLKDKLRNNSNKFQVYGGRYD